MWYLYSYSDNVLAQRPALHYFLLLDLLTSNDFIIAEVSH